MKKLVSLILVLSALLAFGQFGGFRTDQPFLARPSVAAQPSDPSYSGNLYAWWVAADFTGTIVTTNEPWLDRVTGRQFAPLATLDFVTNTTDGMFFNDEVSLTNVPSLQPGTNSTMAVIVYPFVVNASPYPVTIYAPYAMGDGPQAGHPAGLTLNLGKWSWSYPYVGGGDLSSAVTASNWYDVVLVQSNTTVFCYTNGAFSASRTTTAPPSNGWPWNALGRTDAVPPGLDGYIKEVLVWSNALSQVEVSNVHYYATNTYSFAP